MAQGYADGLEGKEFAMPPPHSPEDEEILEEEETYEQQGTP